MQTTNKNFIDVVGGSSGIARRDFLKYTGMGLASAILIANAESCKKDNNGVTNPHNGATVNLSNDDTGILNYAYALEQLEAAFYTQVLTGKYYLNAPANEKAILADIQMHEVCHREFFKAALGTSAIIGLTPFFSNINFDDRTSVLSTAKAFEDLGVSAYNGAAYYINNTAYLGLAGKIVSVEARHASAIRDLLSPNSASFAGDDQVDASTGLDKSSVPSVVLVSASAYITNTITSQLP
jgi:hypothetical protein